MTFFFDLRVKCHPHILGCPSLIKTAICKKHQSVCLRRTEARCIKNCHQKYSPCLFGKDYPNIVKYKYPFFISFPDTLNRGSIKIAFKLLAM